MRDAYEAKGQIKNKLWAENRYAESFRKEALQYIVRPTVKRYMEEFIKSMQVPLQYTLQQVGEQMFDATHANYAIAIAKGELIYHLWGQDAPIIQSVADDIQNLYDTGRDRENLEWIYNYCMLAAGRTDRITNRSLLEDTALENLCQLAEHRDDDTFPEVYERFVRLDLQRLFEYWDQIKPVPVYEWRKAKAEYRLREIYNTVWNSKAEPYRIEGLRQMAEHGTEKERQYAIASMILYSYVMDNIEELNYYLQLSESLSSPPLDAIRQCFK